MRKELKKDYQTVPKLPPIKVSDGGIGVNYECLSQVPAATKEVLEDIVGGIGNIGRRFATKIKAVVEKKETPPSLPLETVSPNEKRMSSLEGTFKDLQKCFNGILNQMEGKEMEEFLKKLRLEVKCFSTTLNHLVLPNSFAEREAYLINSTMDLLKAIEKELPEVLKNDRFG